MNDGGLFDYDVFVSYRTNMYPDKPVAEALQHVLETYPVPNLLKRNIAAPKRWRNRLKVFRDITDLNASSDLSGSIDEKLKRSRFLVVVCTQNITKSDYCAEEIKRFRSFHGDERVLLLLVEGEPKDSLPKTQMLESPIGLLNAGSREDIKARSEPLAADVRAQNLTGILKRLRGPWTPTSQQARFKLLGPILGCESPDDLIQRHAARFRQQLTITTLIVLALVATASLFVRHQNQLTQVRQAAAAMISEIDGQKEYPSKKEFSSLRRLANSPKPVRLSFIEQLVNAADETSEKNADRLRNRFAFVLRAAVGLDLEMRNDVRELIYKHGRNPSSKHPALNYACAELGAELTGRIVTAIETKDQFSTYTFDTSEPLDSLSANLPAEQAAALATRVVATMESDGASIPYGGVGLSNCSSALVSLIKRMEAKDIVSILKSVVCVGDVRKKMLAEVDKKADGIINPIPTFSDAPERVPSVVLRSTPTTLAPRGLMGLRPQIRIGRERRTRVGR